MPEHSSDFLVGYLVAMLATIAKRTPEERAYIIGLLMLLNDPFLDKLFRESGVTME